MCPMTSERTLILKLSHSGEKQKREATLLLAPPYEAFALPCQSNEQRDPTPYVYTRSAFHLGTHGYYIPMSIIVAWS